MYVPCFPPLYCVSKILQAKCVRDNKELWELIHSCICILYCRYVDIHFHIALKCCNQVHVCTHSQSVRPEMKHL